jgi:hypothetical protein
MDGWDYAPGQLRVRTIDGRDNKQKIQIRMDLGLMQLEWMGRPDGAKPHECMSLLEHYRLKQEEHMPENGNEPFSLSREDCWALGQEAMQYYWRRISFFELKEYARAETDAIHNIGILDMCQEFAEHDEDRQIADQYRAFVTAHRIQANALQLLEKEEHDSALDVIRKGIVEIEEVLDALGDLDHEECPELKFLKEWEREVEQNRPLSPTERLRVDLRDAVEQEKFELAADLRDRLRNMGREGR